MIGGVDWSINLLKKEFALECGGLTPPLRRKSGVKPPHSKAPFGRVP